MARPMQVLIVDDQPRARQGLKALLATANRSAEISEAANGAEALRRIEELNPDVVLMDIVMPEMDGLQSTRLIRALAPRITIIVLSMYGEYRTAALGAGADAFIGKGEPLDELLAQLDFVEGALADT